MEQGENRRKRCNLYAVFQADQQANPMPLDRAERIRKNILKKFLEKVKLLEIPVPPD